MCGIYGRWNFAAGPVDVASLEAATRSLRHRGPDDEGYLLADSRSGRALHCRGSDTDPRVEAPELRASAAPEFDLALGFRRLSILDLSPAGHQPMRSADGSLWIAFNGEVYNYRELRDELRALGHTFRSDCDTEVILAAYREWGEACLHRFNGMWGLAIWDAARRTLFLARDRFGVKPLFYTREGGSFAFASEIKALVGAHGIPFRPSAPVVYDFLVVGMLPEPQSGLTFFEGVSSLPPGHLMRVAGESCEVVRYYTPPARGQAAEDADPGAVVREYGELLADSVKLRLRSDVPVGSCLSGGLDSSSIVCLVNGMVEAKVGAAAVGEHQKAFSAVYEAEGAFNERKHIETVLRATGAEANYTYPTVEGLIADAERMVWHQDEPFLSTSIYAQWCVMAKVRERGVTVLLDGQGADEALAGYRPFDIHISGLLRAGRLGRAASELRAMQTVTGVAPAGVLMRSLVRQLPEGLITAARAYRLRRPARFVRQELGGLGAASLPGGERDLQHHLTEQVVNGSLPNLLRYEDRNSMAFSVEARVPFVDYRLIEFSLTRTEGVRIRDGWTKWVLRQAMKGVIPEEIAWRRDKVGFETPERPWITEFLRSRPGLFDDGALSGQYLELAAVRAEVERWLAEGGDARRIWRWINLELWLGVWGRN